MSSANETSGTPASVAAFYDGFASDYDLAYGGDWDRAVAEQGAALARLISETLPGAKHVLDCSCGIGTQAIGLGLHGYEVHGTDISATGIERARVEADRRGVAASFGVADFRDLTGVEGRYDVVISCDNAIPHLLEERDVQEALRQMRAKLRPRGLLVITMRDFDRALVTRPAVAPPVIVSGPPRRVLIRLHDWDAPDSPFYTVRFLVLTEEEAGWRVEEHTTRYRAITRRELAEAAGAAGFIAIRWLTEGAVPEAFGQHVMTALAPAES